MGRESVQSQGWVVGGGQGRCRALGAQRPVAGPQAGRARVAWASGSHEGSQEEHTSTPWPLLGQDTPLPSQGRFIVAAVTLSRSSPPPGKLPKALA